MTLSADVYGLSASGAAGPEGEGAAHEGGGRGAEGGAEGGPGLGASGM